MATSRQLVPRPTTARQRQDNLGALALTLNEPQVARLDEASAVWSG